MAAHPERNRVAARRYADSNPEKIMRASAKKRARQVGIPFDLKTVDLTIPPVCPVLGIEIVKGVGVMSESSPSLDRIVPERGYVTGNVRVISVRANRLKSDASLEELRALVRYLEAHTEENPNIT